MTTQKKILIGIIAGCIVMATVVSGVIFLTTPQQEIVQTNTTPSTPDATTDTPSEEPAYTGEPQRIADRFTVTIPDNWSASISTNPGFIAIMFARPNQLSSLVYQSGTPARVDQNGIPAWSGLTEHFFILAAEPAQAFDPADHQNVTSRSFVFDDGTVGTAYVVTKYADEAQIWGGLLKDDHWIGQTYIYQKDNQRIEAHVARYPSSDIDIALYEQVIASITR